MPKYLKVNWANIIYKVTQFHISYLICVPGFGSLPSCFNEDVLSFV